MTLRPARAEEGEPVGPVPMPAPTASTAADAAGVVRPISLGARRRHLADHEAPFAEVLVSAQSGFPWAFEHLFKVYARPLRAYFDGQGASDAAGSANDVLLRVFRAIGRFEGSESQFRSWVFTIARNSLIDERRKAKRRLPTQSLDEGYDELAGTDDAGEMALSGIGTVEAVRLIEALVPDQREVLLLRIVGDLTIDQIAEVVGKRPGAVKALQRRGLAALRRRLASGG